MAVNDELLEANWGGLAQETAIGTQTLSQLTEEAEACQVSVGTSSCEAVEVLEGSEAGNPVPTQFWFLKPGSPWWAYRLVHLTKHYDRPECRRPVNLISGCTGISAESFVMKAGGHWIQQECEPSCVYRVLASKSAFIASRTVCLCILQAYKTV